MCRRQGKAHLKAMGDDQRPGEVGSRGLPGRKWRAAASACAHDAICIISVPLVDTTVPRGLLSRRNSPRTFAPSNQNPVLSRPPSPHPQYIPFSANAWHRYALPRVYVASQDIPLQANVAEWPRKPATNQLFLIHRQMFLVGVPISCFPVFFMPFCAWYNHNASCFLSRRDVTGIRKKTLDLKN